MKTLLEFGLSMRVIRGAALFFVVLATACNPYQEQEITTDPLLTGDTTHIIPGGDQTSFVWEQNIGYSISGQDVEHIAPLCIGDQVYAVRERLGAGRPETIFGFDLTDGRQSAEIPLPESSTSVTGQLLQHTAQSITVVKEHTIKAYNTADGNLVDTAPLPDGDLNSGNRYFTHFRYVNENRQDYFYSKRNALEWRRCYSTNFTFDGYSTVWPVAVDALSVDTTIIVLGEPANFDQDVFTELTLIAHEIETNTERWRVVIPSYAVIYKGYYDVVKATAIIADGRIYLRDRYQVYAYELSTGIQLWSYRSGIASTEIAKIYQSDENLIVLEADNNIYALNPETGNRVWTFLRPPGLLEERIQVIAGHIYLPGEELTVIDAGTGKVTGTYAIPEWEDLDVPYAASSDGEYVVYHHGTTLYCLAL